MENKLDRRRPISIEPAPEVGSVLHICWMLHNLCNYRCSYCQEFNWNGSDQWLRYDDVLIFIEKVMQHYKKDVYHISFTGGEPTLWPSFEKLCLELKSRSIEIGLTSNGSRRPEYWQKIGHTLNWLCLSYHSESVKDDDFLRVVKTLKQLRSIRMTVRLMMHYEESLWKRAIDMGEKLKSIDEAGTIFFEYVPIQENFGFATGLVRYSPQQQEFLSQAKLVIVDEASYDSSLTGRDVHNNWVFYDNGDKERLNSNELVIRNQVDFKGWNCFIGLDQLFINHEGDILPGGCLQGKKIGNLKDKYFSFPQRPVRCAKSYCPCGTDIETRKYAASFNTVQTGSN